MEITNFYVVLVGILISLCSMETRNESGGLVSLQLWKAWNQIFKMMLLEM